MSVSVAVIRSRRPSDVPVLVELLAAQQPASRYPYRWPLPMPVEDFLVRDAEEAAWVAEVDGAVVGHVAVGEVTGALGATFRRVTGCSSPAIVSVLFVAESEPGTGLGGWLLDTAVGWARARGRVPVLDVIPVHSSALAVYRHRGWIEVGRTRFEWLPDGEPDVVLMALPLYEGAQETGAE